MLRRNLFWIVALFLWTGCDGQTSKTTLQTSSNGEPLNTLDESAESENSMETDEADKAKEGNESSSEDEVKAEEEAEEASDPQNEDAPEDTDEESEEDTDEESGEDTEEESEEGTDKESEEDTEENEGEGKYNIATCGDLISCLEQCPEEGPGAETCPEKECFGQASPEAGEAFGAMMECSFKASEFCDEDDEECSQEFCQEEFGTCFGDLVGGGLCIEIMLGEADFDDEEFESEIGENNSKKCPSIAEVSAILDESMSSDEDMDSEEETDSPCQDPTPQGSEDTCVLNFMCEEVNPEVASLEGSMTYFENGELVLELTVWVLSKGDDGATAKEKCEYTLNNTWTFD